jgi:hypothetical protein
VSGVRGHKSETYYISTTNGFLDHLSSQVNAQGVMFSLGFFAILPSSMMRSPSSDAEMKALEGKDHYLVTSGIFPLLLLVSGEMFYPIQIDQIWADLIIA